MNPFKEHISGYSPDDASSVYSRSPESPKPVLKLMPIILPIRHDLPEINTLEHQIALARGSTMALETTRSRLRGSKTRHRLSLSELKEEKIRQRDQQEHENEFYRTCFKSLHRLVTVVIESIQGLVLQYHFEPEATPSGNPHLLQTIKLLRLALEKSRAQEAQAEQEWTRQWNISRVGRPTVRWI
ncbi:hypothetical protein N7490_006614 [Penicillium lividum]|nr:hypothetical protein N7490_006614 [Penicillium lividum]